MTPMNWSGVSVTFDGVPFEGTVGIDYAASEDPDYGLGLSEIIRQPAVSASVECTVPMASLGDFASMFHHEPPGASAATLARRVRYGGRKGRSALRRLFRRALPIEMRSEHTQFRGTAVVLDEQTLVVRARAVPR